MFETTRYVLERFEYGRSITYDVKDVTGNLLGYVKGKRGSKPGYVEFWFTDNTGVQLGHIEGKLITVRRQYEIKDKDGQLKARIKQKVLQLFGSEWRMEDPAGQQLAKAKGDVLGHNFQILAPGGGIIAKIHREWISLRALVGITHTTSRSYVKTSIPSWS